MEMMDREKVISELDTQIRWIEEIDAHKFPGWWGATMAMRYAMMLMKEQKSIIPWLSELMLNTNDDPIKPSEVIRRIEEGGLKRFAEEESQ